jgi:penicillin-binding protein 1A
VTEVVDSTGNVIYRRLGSGPGLRIDPTLVANMNRMLTAVVQTGTGRAAATGRPVAGKTGTTDDYRDAWFIGYSADNIAGVWMGNDDRTPMKKVTGGGLPAQVWHDIMVAADSGKPQRALPKEEQQQRPGPVQSFLDSLLGSVFGGGNRGTTNSATPNSATPNSGTSRGPRDTQPPARKPNVVYEYPGQDRPSWRD